MNIFPIVLKPVIRLLVCTIDMFIQVMNDKVGGEMKVAYFTPFIDWSSANLFLSRLYFYQQYKNKNGDKTILFYLHFVRVKGLEPPRLTAPDPKSGAATNYATSAH